MKTKISLKRILVVLFVMMGLFSSSVAQNKAEFSRLVKFYSNIKNFDYNHPREKVYLHLDNYAYIEGETMWFKAYVIKGGFRDGLPGFIRACLEAHYQFIMLSKMAEAKREAFASSATKALAGNGDELRSRDICQSGGTAGRNG